MFDFTIDGRIVSVKEGTTILEAARSAGLHIPTLCYLKNVSSIGSCRLCVVEVEGTAGLVSSCNTLVKPGMVVHTNSDAITAARRTALQLIIADHGLNTSTVSAVRKTAAANCRTAAESSALKRRPLTLSPPGDRSSTRTPSLPLIPRSAFAASAA